MQLDCTLHYSDEKRTYSISGWENGGWNPYVIIYMTVLSMTMGLS